MFDFTPTFIIVTNEGADGNYQSRIGGFIISKYGSSYGNSFIDYNYSNLGMVFQYFPNTWSGNSISWYGVGNGGSHQQPIHQMNINNFNYRWYAFKYNI